MDNQLLSVVGMQQPKVEMTSSAVGTCGRWGGVHVGANSRGRNRMACWGGGSVNKKAFCETRASSDA